MKKSRECLIEFFKNHIEQISVCENCGFRIDNPDAKNVAHIVPKSTYKEVMCEVNNALYLCSSLDRTDKRGCHEEYDKSWESAMKMPIWTTAKERFKKFSHLITKKSFTLLNFNDEK